MNGVEFEHMRWAYRAVFTQAAAGGGTIQIQFIARERTVICFGNIGRDNYAAARTISAFIKDKNNAIIGDLLYPSPVDDVRLPLINFGMVAAIAVEKTLALSECVVLGVGDKIVVQTDALVQNETLTIAMRGFVDMYQPTVVTTGSGGTVTVVTTYDEMI